MLGTGKVFCFISYRHSPAQHNVIHVSTLDLYLFTKFILLPVRCYCSPLSKVVKSSSPHFHSGRSPGTVLPRMVELPLPHWLIAGVILFAGVSLYPKRHRIPRLGPPSPFGYVYTAIRFLIHSDKVVNEGLTKVSSLEIKSPVLSDKSVYSMVELHSFSLRSEEAYSYFPRRSMRRSSPVTIQW